MVHFGWNTDGRDVVHDFVDQVAGRTFLVTGPSEKSIGAETVVTLAGAHPARLVLVARALGRVQSVIDAIRAIDSSISVSFIQADLSSMASVRKAAQQVLGDPEIEYIDVIINNAGIMAPPYHRTEDGFELQFAANHLGHFLLTNLLMPKVLSSPHKNTRIVIVASSGNKYSDINWSDPNFTALPSTYTPYFGYGQSKTANALFAIGLNARLANPRHPGFHAYALHPGSSASNLQVNMTPEIAADAMERIFGRDPVTGELRPRPPLKTLQQACATTLRAALDPNLPQQEGVWLNDCNITDEKDPQGMVASWALDAVAAERCWKLSEELLGQEFKY